MLELLRRPDEADDSMKTWGEMERIPGSTHPLPVHLEVGVVHLLQLSAQGPKELHVLRKIRCGIRRLQLTMDER